MRKFLDGLYSLSFYAAAGFILSICLVVLGQVLLNLVDRIWGLMFGTAIGLTIPSYADFTGFFLAAASFLALAGTLRDGGHIRVTLVTAMFSKPVQKRFDIGAVALALGATIYATWYSFKLVHESFFYNDLSSGIIAVPLWIPQSTIAIGLSILAIALLDDLISLVRGNPASFEGKGENLLQEVATKE